MAEKSTSSIFESVKYFLASGFGIARKKYKDDKAEQKIRKTGNEASKDKLQVPELDLLLKSLAPILIEALANIPEDTDELELWENFDWKSEEDHNFLDLLGVVICFADLHDQEIHKNLIPDRSQTEAYIEAVTSDREENISLAEQLKVALALTKNSPISAIFLALIGSRMLARRMDERFYDEKIEITDEMMREFKKNVSSFHKRIKESDEKSEVDSQVEDSGDTYYFWTSCCMGIVLRFMEEKNPIKANILIKPFYRNGIFLMMFARKYFAKEPNFSSHEIPEKMGFNAGWALAEEALAKQN